MKQQIMTHSLTDDEAYRIGFALACGYDDGWLSNEMKEAEWPIESYTMGMADAASLDVLPPYPWSPGHYLGSRLPNTITGQFQEGWCVAVRYFKEEDDTMEESYGYYFDPLGILPLPDHFKWRLSRWINCSEWVGWDPTSGEEEEL